MNAMTLRPVNMNENEISYLGKLSNDSTLIIEKIKKSYAQSNLDRAINYISFYSKNSEALDLDLLAHGQSRQDNVIALSEYIKTDIFEVVEQLEEQFGNHDDIYIEGYKKAICNDFMQHWQEKNYTINDNLQVLEKFLSGYEQKLCDYHKAVSYREKIVQAFAHEGIFEQTRHLDKDDNWYCSTEVVELKSNKGAILIHQEHGFSQNIVISADLCSVSYEITIKCNKPLNVFHKAQQFAQFLKTV